MKLLDYRLLATRALGLLCILLLAASAVYPLLNRNSGACVQPQPGVIDLSGCTFDNDSTYKLDGKWEFYWNQLLEPTDTIQADKVSYLSVPGSWRTWNQKEYNRYGFATYRLQLLLPENSTSFALKVNNVRTSSQLFIDGEPLGGSGLTGQSLQETVPRNQPYTAAFNSDTGRADIIIHASNFMYNSGAIAESIRIGTPEAIEALDKRNNVYDIVLIAGFAFIGVYFMGQGLQRKEDYPSLQLGMYCLTITFYLLTHSEKLLFDLSPSIPYEWFSKIQLITGVIGFSFVASYTYSLFPALYSRLFRRITFTYSIGFCLLTLVSSERIYSRASDILTIFSIISIIYTFYVMVKAAMLRETGSFYLLIGVVAAIMFVLTVSKNLMMGTEFYSIPPLSGPIFVLAEGLFLSARQAHAYETIKQLSHQLERKDRDKDEFLLKTSNELRTPLNAIINISLSLYEGGGGPLSSSQREDMRLILGTGRRLAFMVRDILDYEQIKQQRITLHWKQVDIQGIANIVIEVFQFLNIKTNIRIKNHIPPGAYLIEADEHRLMQILYNLLDNALKFTDRGSIVFEAERSGDVISITVTDTGKGIPPERLESIFRDYEQVNEADSLESGGLGLGLAITRKLVELHGGSIRVQSVSGRGSSFTFSIPVSQPSSASAAAEPENRELLLTPVKPSPEALDDDWKYPLIPVTQPGLSADAGPDTPRILVVDDDYANLKALTNLLALENYMITSIRSGKEALALLAGDRNFDLCIIDVMMPEMSGLELCRIIRQTFSPLDLPVLMATAGQQLHFNESAFRAGANDFIHKPYAWSDLKGRVKTLVELKRSVAERLSSEIAMLRAQIKPHFLYNSINTIIWMSTRDNEKTRHLLYDLSHFLRGSFDFSNQETAIPFEKELELTEAYLSLEQARFGKRLSVQYNIEVSEFTLPPLIVQPIVENAVRHGLMEKIGGGTLVLSTSLLEGYIVITVSDNGKGMSDEQLASWMMDDYRSSPRQGTGIGLKNINRRLLKQFGHPLLLTRGEDSGIEVRIRIPWKGEVS
ncbi:ATP-binding protein [Paenibacillus camerounensis]|uniref:ATP-binding protein n=1 Tax=Paenibacillus camerounensis TaxID=1243663 RepID=UPI0005A93A4A|nr:ATP-binding protein [Paenibacillus camerounensis]